MDLTTEAGKGSMCILDSEMFVKMGVNTLKGDMAPFKRVLVPFAKM